MRVHFSCLLSKSPYDFTRDNRFLDDATRSGAAERLENWLHDLSVISRVGG